MKSRTTDQAVVAETVQRKGRAEGSAGETTGDRRLAEPQRINKEALIGLCTFDTNLRYVHVNDWLAALNGIPAEDHLGRTIAEVLPHVAEGVETQLRQVIDTGEPIVGGTVDAETPAHPGLIKSFQHSYSAIRSDDGTVIGVGCIVQEVTERKRAEDEIRRLNKELEQRVRERTRELRRELRERKRAEQELERTQFALDHASDAAIWLDRDGRIVYANTATEIMLGYSHEELLTLSVPDYDPDASLDEFSRAFERIKARGPYTFEARHRTNAGNDVQVEMSLHHMRFDGVELMCSYSRDITERMKLENQLRESQKMEAVGRLTGGVAHDFNNLLQIITGNLELLQSRLKADNRAHVLIEEALIGARRGAESTKRLLAFARKQRLEPAVVNVNEFIIGMTKILRRSLGEDIEIETVEARSPWKTRVDANQLENAILNLAINSRDAMPSGGKLTMETANVHLDDKFLRMHPDAAPGTYVMLEVRDTGTGMPPEAAKHAFEPFFTTKEPGKGTGLGLSMVYGFVKQSGGHVTIESEVGVGTTVKLYLPRARVSRVVKHPPAKGRPAAVEGKTILVVEDDAGVRRVVAKQLRELGYRAIGARDGRDALKVLSGDRRIDLIFTDVVMPGGLSGIDLVHKARERWPGLKVLLTSGYAENVIAPMGTLGHEFELLRKPYRAEDLSRKMHEALTIYSGEEIDA